MEKDRIKRMQEGNYEMGQKIKRLKKEMEID